VAASFIIAVAALGLLRTTVGPDGVVRGESPSGQSSGPVIPPPNEPTNTPTQPEPPTNTDHRAKHEPLGPVVLLAQVAPTTTSNPPDHTNEPPKPPNEGDGNGPGGGGGGDDGDGEGPPGHNKGFNGYDNPRVPLVGSHRFDTSQNRGHQAPPCDPRPEHGKDAHAHPACT
jgi:hypothetical protein